MPCPKCGSKNRYQEICDPCTECSNRDTKTNTRPEEYTPECEECSLSTISFLVCKDCEFKEFDD